MKVIIGNHTFIVRDRQEAIDTIKIELKPRMKKGEHLVWTKSSEVVQETNRISIVDSRGIVKLTAKILGGSKMAKVTKATKVKKTAATKVPAKKTSTASKKVAKKITPVKKSTQNRQTALAKVILALPKSGLSSKEISTRVSEKYGLSDRPSETKQSLNLLIEVGFIKEADGKYTKC